MLWRKLWALNQENKKLKELHKKVFIPNYIELKNNTSNFNNLNLDIYVREIIKEILIAKKKNVILSDENIFDFFNYDVNKNFIILSKIIKILRKRLNLEIYFRLKGGIIDAIIDLLSGIVKMLVGVVKIIVQFFLSITCDRFSDGS